LSFTNYDADETITIVYPTAVVEAMADVGPNASRF
jgi:hypothetical protein